MACPYMHDSVWLQQRKFEDAEAFYQKVLVGSSTTGAQQAGPSGQKTETSSIKNEIAQARQHIQNVLRSGGCSGAAASSGGGDATARIENLEKENKELRNAVDEMKSLVQKLEGRVKILEGGSSAPAASAAPSAATAVAPAAASAAADDDDSDSDVDLFGSEDEEEVAERERVKQERVKAYQEKKAKKPALVAKSSVILDVKPYDDETDMKAVEDSLRLIKQDGLVWGAAKLVPLAYGIKKLQIGIVIEDAKVSVEELSEKITEDYEDLVQSVDIAAFNKL
ncbi:elongation factor 1-delta-like isoform X1 [Ylistrum balloti]|uniref:elongation factor 1-delta-like isoform X1 n=1 Tax=Ylistrum balloti TaxID=509963 RepID=UPI002905A75E|nr:elongation factor 1-delta-like isoform X1 [Ylistrum balloti]